MITKKLTLDYENLVQDMLNSHVQDNIHIDIKFDTTNIPMTSSDSPVKELEITFNHVTTQFELDVEFENGDIQSFDERDYDIVYYTNNYAEMVITDGILRFENVTFISFDYDLLKDYVIFEDGKINLVVYRNNSERQKLTKDLTFVGLLSGNFNNSISLKNPVIDVENFSLSDTYNYVHVINLNRYYYVDSVDLVSKDIRRLYLMEDVLMSFADLIRNQTAFIDRAEEQYNVDLKDNLVVTEGENEVVYIPLEWYNNENPFVVYDDVSDSYNNEFVVTYVSRG